MSSSTVSSHSSSSDNDSYSSSEVSDPTGFDTTTPTLTSDANLRLISNLSSLNCSAGPMNYMQMLDRLYDKLAVQGRTDQKSKIVLSVNRMAGGKTSINIAEVADSFNRNTNFLENYIFETLNTTGSINSQGHLILKSVFSRNDIMKTVTGFARKYVACPACKSVNNTELTKNGRVYFIECRSCGASKSIGNIKSSYL